jgi:hypothetical protein
MDPARRFLRAVPHAHACTPGLSKNDLPKLATLRNQYTLQVSDHLTVICQLRL